MAELIYNWQRLWCPRGGKYRLDGLGYPYGPTSYNPVFRFESIAEAPCLVLLGEPAMGKSYVLKEEHENARRGTIEKGGDAEHIDLRRYESAEAVHSAIFEHPQFQRWRVGGHELELYIDSLDECRVSVKTVAQVLADGFKQYPPERLRLRIACRTADWTSFLEGELRRHWKEGSVRVYELIPLTRDDVREAATANEIDADAFLREVELRGAVPLAIRPTTLKMLLALYKPGGTLPRKRSELYQKGCLQLSVETNESRRASGRVGPLSAEQCMMVAGRIAAVMAFGGHASVWRGAHRGDAVPGDDVLLSNLRGWSETVQGEQFSVDDAALRQTLVDTGFFTAHGDETDRFGWTQATFGEFLAAWYLVERRATTEQVMRFLVHPSDEQGRLAPQLYEVAAWLAGMMPEVFERILQTDPKVLLRVDEVAMQPAQRAALADALLKQYDEKRAYEDFETHALYRKLTHPGLATQLEPYIRDRDKHFAVRRVAIEIADVCKVNGLQELLANVALAEAEPMAVRISAVAAVSEVGDSDTRGRLKGLAEHGAANDRDNELKGYALSAVWREHMTVDELFASLAPPRESFHGAYDIFLSHHLVERLRPEDLPTALRWVAAQGKRRELPYATARLMNDIMLHATEHLDTPDVLDLFAEAALARLQHHDQIFESDFFDPNERARLESDDHLRRRVLEALFDRLPDPEENWNLIMYSRTFSVLEKDLPWLIEIYEAADEESTRRRTLRHLIRRYFEGQHINPEALTAIYDACHRTLEVKHAFCSILKDQDPHSEEAKRERESYNFIHDKNQRSRQPQRQVEPPPAARVAEDLAGSEAGDLNAWPRLNYDLSIKPDGFLYALKHQADLIGTPGWQEADEPTRARIIEAARLYVLEGDPRTTEWVGADDTSPAADAGYRALHLLITREPSFIASLPSERWAKWAPIVLLFPIYSASEEEKRAPHRELIILAYRHAPEVVVSTLLVKIDKTNREGNYSLELSKLKYIWDARLGAALLEKAKDRALKPQYQSELLNLLLEHAAEGAQKFTESLISSPLPTEDEDNRRALLAARALVIHTDDCGWHVVWPAMNADENFARKLAEMFSQNPMRRSVAERLTEDEVADLYLWLAQRYPPGDDPEFDGVHTVTTREAIGDWRTGLLQRLKMRGSLEACQAIERIMREMPELERLYVTLLEAQEEMLRRTWVTHSHPDVINFAGKDAPQHQHAG